MLAAMSDHDGGNDGGDGDMAKELTELIDHLARNALVRGQPGWPTIDHTEHVAAVRAALEAHADAGGFARWGVATKAQLRDVPVAVGFDSDQRLFVLNPEFMASALIRAGMTG
jgi:hypothetical protein